MGCAHSSPLGLAPVEAFYLVLREPALRAKGAHSASRGSGAGLFVALQVTAGVRGRRPRLNRGPVAQLVRAHA